MMDKFKSGLKNVFSYVVHGESVADRQRKAQVVEQVVQRSLPSAPDSGPLSLGNSYETRLREVLVNTNTRALDTLLRNDISVVLDTRFQGQTLGWFDKEVLGVFYNDQNKGGTVALWDNGKMAADTGFFDRSAFEHGPSMIEKLAEKMGEGRISAQEERYYAARYMRHYGKYIQHYTDWRSEGDFSAGTVRRNPDLHKPPQPKGRPYRSISP